MSPIAARDVTFPRRLLSQTFSTLRAKIRYSDTGKGVHTSHVHTTRFLLFITARKRKSVTSHGPDFCIYKNYFNLSSEKDCRRGWSVSCFYNIFWRRRNIFLWVWNMESEKIKKSFSWFRLRKCKVKKHWRLSKLFFHVI